MMKANGLHFGLALILFLVGVYLNDFMGAKPIGDLVAYTGLFYGLVTLAASLFGRKLPRITKNQVMTEKHQMEKLLTLKKLLDSGAITKDEYDEKAKKLKKSIL